MGAGNPVYYDSEEKDTAALQFTTILLRFGYRNAVYRGLHIAKLVGLSYYP